MRATSTSGTSSQDSNNWRLAYSDLALLGRVDELCRGTRINLVLARFASVFWMRHPAGMHRHQPVHNIEYLLLLLSHPLKCPEAGRGANIGRVSLNRGKCTCYTCLGKISPSQEVLFCSFQHCTMHSVRLHLCVSDQELIKFSIRTK